MKYNRGVSARRAICGGLSALVVIMATPAFADESDADRARCKASYERAQVLVRDEHFDAARSQLDICIETCPVALVSDCRKWSRDVENLTPTVRLAAHDALGNALTDVRVSVDGNHLDAPFGGAIRIDPGTRVFLFERPGFAPTTTSLDVHAGERDRTVSVVLVAVERALPPPPPPRPSPAASYVVGGIGAAALITSGVLTIKGFADRSSLRSSCAPKCDPSAVDAISAEWWAAGGIATGGAVAVGIAVLLWPRSEHASSGAVPAVTISPRAFAATWNLP